MKLNFARVILFAGASAVGLGMGQTATVANPEITSHETKLAQVYSPKCSTPVGICLVTPAPVGAPCACGSNRGQIVP